MTSTVTRKLSGAPGGGPAPDEPDRRLEMNGMTVTGMSMITVPDTAGVRTR